jgi:hypothetical protein
MWTLRQDGWHEVASWAIGPSRIHGRGIICTQKVLAFEVLGIAHRWANGRWRTTHDLGAFHNHSPSPTCGNHAAAGLRYLIALRDLQPGDEITVDYRLQPDLEQPRAGWQ